MTEESFRYELQNEQPVILGHGASGITYKGWYRPDGEKGGPAAQEIPAALKQIVGQSGTGGFSLTREVHLLARTKTLESPNIVNYLALFYPHTAPLIVTEYIDGTTLQVMVESAVTQGTISSPEWIRRVLNWGRPLCSALHQVHDLRIRHHDVKPSNVIIRGYDQVPILIDFGIGRDVETQPELTVRNFLGTPAYASPEQFCTGLDTCEACQETSTKCDLTYATDIYGLGGTLWFALTGQAPFSVTISKEGDLRPLARAKRQGIQDPSPLPDIPELRDLMCSMLAPDAARRPKAADVELALLAIIKQLPTPAVADPVSLPIALRSSLSRSFFQVLPKFAQIDRNKEIAVTPLQIFAQTFWVPELADRIDFNDSKTSPARMSYQAAEHIVSVINRDSTAISTGWRYRLPKQGEWMRGAGYLPDATGGAKRLFPRLYRETGEQEYEWTDEPGGGYPECRAVRYLDGESWRTTERHRAWPKGVIRLVRERR